MASGYKKGSHTTVHLKCITIDPLVFKLNSSRLFKTSSNQEPSSLDDAKTPLVAQIQRNTTYFPGRKPEEGKMGSPTNRLESLSQQEPNLACGSGCSLSQNTHTLISYQINVIKIALVQQNRSVEPVWRQIWGPSLEQTYKMGS